LVRSVFCLALRPRPELSPKRPAKATTDEREQRERRRRHTWILLSPSTVDTDTTDRQKRIPNGTPYLPTGMVLLDFALEPRVPTRVALFTASQKEQTRAADEQTRYDTRSCERETEAVMEMTLRSQLRLERTNLENDR